MGSEQLSYVLEIEECKGIYDWKTAHFPEKEGSKQDTVLQIAWKSNGSTMINLHGNAQQPTHHIHVWADHFLPFSTARCDR